MRAGALIVAAFVLAGCGGTTTVTKTVTVAAPRASVQFGYVKSLERRGAGYVLRFDPAWLLLGETANAAAAEDGQVAPGEPVPNDSYRVDEGHRLLTYKVPSSARVTVLKTGPQSTPITVAELAAIVHRGRPTLWEPISTGFWIRVDIDTVKSLDQQYVP